MSGSVCWRGHLLGCLGSMATRTMGVASKLRGVKGGQAGEVEMVADLSTKSSRPPIPEREQKRARESERERERERERESAREKTLNILEEGKDRKDMKGKRLR